MVAILTTGISTGAVWFLLHRPASASSAQAKAKIKPAGDPKKVVTVYPLEQFVVNLADTDHPTFLRIGIDLGVSKKLEATETAKDSPFTPQLRDAILGVLSSYQASQLLAPDGKGKLKAQLLSTLQNRLPDLDITQVYFTDFIVQE